MTDNQKTSCILNDSDYHADYLIHLPITEVCMKKLLCLFVLGVFAVVATPSFASTAVSKKDKKKEAPKEEAAPEGEKKAEEPAPADGAKKKEEKKDEKKEEKKEAPKQ